MIRLLGHVEIVHIISFDGSWDQRPHFSCHSHPSELVLSSARGRAKFSWLDMDEAREMREWPQIFASIGERIPRLARLDSRDTPTAQANVVNMLSKLKMERETFPDGWTMPQVVLDYMKIDFGQSKPPKVRTSSMIERMAVSRSIRIVRSLGINAKERLKSMFLESGKRAWHRAKESISLQSKVDLMFKSTWTMRAEIKASGNRSL